VPLSAVADAINPKKEHSNEEVYNDHPPSKPSF